MRYWCALVFFLLTSCNNNWGKYGGYKLEYGSVLDYYVVLDKGNELTAADNREQIMQKGIAIKFHNPAGAIDTVILGRGAIVIETFVDKNNTFFDEKFILVDQKPLTSICECDSACMSRLPSGKKQTYAKCEEALKKSKYHQYWIIEKLNDNIYGPFTKAVFLRKRKELGVSSKLKVSFYK